MTEETATRPRWLSRWLTWIFVAITIVVVYGVWEVSKIPSSRIGFQPPEMALAQYTPRDVIGELGGMKVRIPRHYAEYVEYDGDPGFGEKREGPRPDRTFNSKLASFGMSVRFPDMKGLESKELREEYRRFELKPDNPWIRVGINAGEIYPRTGERALYMQSKRLWQKSEYWSENYVRLPKKHYGLEAYVVTGTDPETGRPARESERTRDIYIQRSKPDHVTTHISCGRTSVPGGIAHCRMHFGLEPKAKVLVSISFYPDLLPQWHAMREAVRDLCWSFEIDENTQNEIQKNLKPSTKN